MPGIYGPLSAGGVAGGPVEWGMACSHPSRSFRAAVKLVTLLALLAACGPDSPMASPGPGVPLELAEARAAAVQDLRYDVAFDIPGLRTAPVRGRVAVAFTWAAGGEDVVLDFRAPADHVGSVTLDGDTVEAKVVPDHVVIPDVTAGSHTVTVTFTSTDAALNRQEDFLYALFVPDRASTAFPVFEQPNLKARFTVALTIPAAWQALSNGALVARDSVAAGPGRHRLRFATTEPISTYLLTFAAGQLRTVTAERAGRTFTMYHRETDTAKVTRNAPAIFDLHAQALAWLEAYTGIPYPFPKYDFLAVPAFQFGGMEHPGAVWYRADALFLDEAPSRAQELGRASLISHETAHMWFGDLVTMRWFNDVWMKEVFANFMAAKIVAPAFPDIDHGLRFFTAYHPTAYGVDRTAGTHPIRQPLANLREAGSLYGAIIYQKAPVVMKQLEALVGDSTFREGLRRYLAAHRFGNASWPDLVAVLDSVSPMDVTAWSRGWVEEAGRPTVRVTAEAGALVAEQVERPRTQHLSVLVVAGDSTRVVDLSLAGATTRAALPAAVGAPVAVLPGADGVSYGRFPLDSASREWLLVNASTLRAPLHRAVAWQALQEEMLDGTVRPRTLHYAALNALVAEPDELVAAQLLGILRSTYWRFLDPELRLAVAPATEKTLWGVLDAAPTPGRKGAVFNAIIGMTLTPEGIARLERIWRKAETPTGFPISEAQYIAIAEGLAIRGVPDAEAILDEQEARITNPDRRARQRFMRAALSNNVRVRDSLFATFAAVEQRRRESWVTDALAAMHHPLRAREAQAQLPAVLDLAEAVQQTGDIFFPLGWMSAALGGHQSAEAAETVRAFLDSRPDTYPERLRGKMLQAADDLFRAARIVDGWTGRTPPLVPER